MRSPRRGGKKQMPLPQPLPLLFGPGYCHLVNLILLITPMLRTPHQQNQERHEFNSKLFFRQQQQGWKYKFSSSPSEVWYFLYYISTTINFIIIFSLFFLVSYFLCCDMVRNIYIYIHEECE